MDTGCADTLGLVVKSDTSMTSLVALDGKSLHMRGTAVTQLQRLDGSVHLQCTKVTVVIVDSLAVVASSLLIGADVISGAGGVRLEYGDDNKLSGVTFGKPEVVAATVPTSHPLPHVRVEQRGDNVILITDDGQVKWDCAAQRWILFWQWKAGNPPSCPIGHGIGEYSRSKLTPDQERLLGAEVTQWNEAGWLVPHDSAVHGEPAAVLPFLAQVQEHKASTPVRPCLDYRILNDLLASHPGREALVCDETLRKWRRVGNPSNLRLLDIRKAYLQVHVAPDLQRFQTVIWQGRAYVMTRMGFGMNIAPKFMDIIVRWVTHEFPEVHNYVDDVMTPPPPMRR